MDEKWTEDQWRGEDESRAVTLYIFLSTTTKGRNGEGRWKCTHKGRGRMVEDLHFFTVEKNACRRKCRRWRWQSHGERRSWKKLDGRPVARWGWGSRGEKSGSKTERRSRQWRTFVMSRRSETVNRDCHESSQVAAMEENDEEWERIVREWWW